MARFVIDTGDLKLDESQVKALETDLQDTAAKHLIDFARIGPIVTKFPGPWAGGIWGRDIDFLNGVEKDLGQILR